MSFPDTEQLVEALVKSKSTFDNNLRIIASRLKQYHDLCTTHEGTIVGLQSQVREMDIRDEEIRQLKEEITKLKQEIVTLTAKLQSYDAHPDVKAARRARLEAAKASIEQELKKL